jgi:phosphopantetheine adenylyltransferase
MYPFNELHIIHSSLLNFALIFTLQTSLIFLLASISAKKKKKKIQNFTICCWQNINVWALQDHHLSMHGLDGEELCEVCKVAPHKT